MKSRVWVYLSDTPFSNEAEASLKNDIQQFLAGWNAHGTSLSSSFEIRHHQIIIIKADEEKFGASGCSIDKQLRFIKETEAKYGVSLLNRLLVAYHENGHIKIVHSSKIKDLLDQGVLNENTKIFNVGVGNEVELNEHFEQPLKNSWLSRFIPSGV